MALLNDFVQAWVPLFVAMDPVGMVPLFLTLTDGLSPQERRSTAWQATVTAAAVSLIFVGIGRAVFDALGITMADFQIAGGLIFLILAGQELLNLARVSPVRHQDLGVVPLGTPLVAGPATLVALLVLMDASPVPVVLAAFGVNLLLVWLAFRWSSVLARVIGLRGLRAFSKIIALLLAAFAVSMIRKGIQSF